jgi:polysaccharide biosynthesis transport protein
MLLVASHSTGSTLEPAPFAPATGVEFREYIAVLRNRKWSIAVVVALVVGGAIAFSIRQTPLYESKTKVLIEALQIRGGGAAGDITTNMDTESQVVGSSSVAELVAGDLGVQEPIDQLLEPLNVEVVPNTEVLTISYRDPNPEEARRRANAFARAYLEFRRERLLREVTAGIERLRAEVQDLTVRLQHTIEQIGSEADPVVRMQLRARANTLAAQIGLLQQQIQDVEPDAGLLVGQIILPASLPQSPVVPNYLMNVTLALFAGLALGIGLAFLRERLDERLRGADDLEAHTHAPVLAVVPKLSGWRKREEDMLVTVSNTDSQAAEAYRTLRVAVLFAAANRGMKSFLVTSSRPDEGKTMTAANLGVTLAQAGKRVVVVSADRRRPRLHRFFGCPNSVGLTNVLAGEADLRSALHQSGINNLRVLSSGAWIGNYDAVFGSDPMVRLLSELRKYADLVLIDAGPVLGVADTVSLAPLVDGVLVVANADRATRRSVRQAMQQLEKVDATVLGCVLNNYDVHDVSYDYPSRHVRRNLFALFRRPKSRPPTIPHEREDSRTPSGDQLREDWDGVVSKSPRNPS